MCGQNSRDSHNPAPALGQDPGWPGQTHTPSGSRAGYWVKTARARHAVFLPSPPPDPGLILELLSNNKASSRVSQDHFKAEFFLFGNYLISKYDSQICKIPCVWKQTASPERWLKARFPPPPPPQTHTHSLEATGKLNERQYGGPPSHAHGWRHVNDISIKVHVRARACAHARSGESGSNYLYFGWTLAFPLTFSLMYESCGPCDPAVNPQKKGGKNPDRLSSVPTKMKPN